MTKERKELRFEEASAVIRRLKADGRRIVQCHGTFDLLHPGHIVQFEEAKALGDVLVVTVTGEKFVNKGPGRPYFNDQLRVKSLTALECVDYVIIVPYPAAVEAIECVHPDVYCKGKEYQNTEVDVTGNIHDDIKTVERLGGKVAYVGSVVFSSTRLLNNAFDTYSSEAKQFCAQLAREFSFDEFRRLVDGFGDIRVLIVGDIIFDRYTTTSVQGLTSKNRILSARFIEDELQGGGSLAVLRHVKEFTSNVKLISVVGTEPWVDAELGRYMDVEEDEVIRLSRCTTVVKQRYVEPLHEGKALAKLFAINYLDLNRPSPEVERILCERVAAHVGQADLVLAMDFGHGVMQDGVRELVQEKASFLALNCQTNSSNHGFNLINRQYRKADCFSLDETEMTLACGRRYVDFQKELTSLKSFLGSKYAWLTRGVVETIGLKDGEDACICPPFENSVVDTVGAGDAFCALASLAAVKGLPIRLATFMGQLAGAQAVRIVGNAEPVRKAKFLKAGQAMLSF